MVASATHGGLFGHIEAITKLRLWYTYTFHVGVAPRRNPRLTCVGSFGRTAPGSAACLKVSFKGGANCHAKISDSGSPTLVNLQDGDRVERVNPLLPSSRGGSNRRRCEVGKSCAHHAEARQRCGKGLDNLRGRPRTPVPQVANRPPRGSASAFQTGSRFISHRFQHRPKAYETSLRMYRDNSFQPPPMFWRCDSSRGRSNGGAA